MYDNLTRTNLEFAHREAEKRITELEKACEETQELLDRQIEATKNYNAIIAEYEKHYKERIAELEKANEWHYVKDGDYPKDNKPVLCILGDIDSDNCEVGYYNDVGSGEPWHFETYHLPDDDGDNAWGVIAWKEIVLPELKESE